MATEIVAGSTRKNIVIQIVDENNVPINLTGGAVRLQGKSPELPAAAIDQLGVITDAAQGLVTWVGGGNYVVNTQLTTTVITAASYSFRWKLTDVAAKIDFGPAFTIVWVLQPI